MLKSLARRILELDNEIVMLGEILIPLVAQAAPELVERVGVGRAPRRARESTSRIRNERAGETAYP